MAKCVPKRCYGNKGQVNVIQIEFIDILYLLITVWVVLFFVQFFNKRYVFRNRKSQTFNQQMNDIFILNNKIHKDIVFELYEDINKYFKVKTCYLLPSDKIKTFYDISSFNLHEDYEDFIDHLYYKYNISIELEQTLLDVMIAMNKQRNIEIKG